MEEKLYQRLLIFDGSHALHRAICEPHLWEMKNFEGQRTGGIYGTLQTILKESSTFNYFPVVVFDGHLSQRRLDIYPNYKKHEDKMLLQESVEQLTEMELLQREQRAEYNRQREILKLLLPAYGIPVIHLDNWEGDDLIYILSLLTRDSIVVSDDKDMIQLVRDEEDNRCRVRRGMRDEFINTQWFLENGLTRNEFVARKALVGDPSDNIPSACFQVGEKTALGLYKLYTESAKMVGGFPKNEDELTTKCKEIGIPKRKAYLNFDEEQFLKNILLMDLSLVESEITPELVEELNEIITTQSELRDTSIIKDTLEELDIRTFISDNLLNNVERNKSYIHKDYNTNFRAIQEVNTNSPTTVKTKSQCSLF